jgi:hypothetical protein
LNPHQTKWRRTLKAADINRIENNQRNKDQEHQPQNDNTDTNQATNKYILVFTILGFATFYTKK